MRTAAWLLFVAGVAVCVYVDAWRRGVRIVGVFWAIGAALLSLVVVPLWFAARPLREFEVRQGGFAANAWHGFSVIWAAALSFNALTLVVIDRRVAFAIGFWLVSMFVSSLVIVPVSGLLTKDVIERGNGVGGQRIQAFAGWFSRFRHARLPSEGAPSDRDPVRVARAALRDIEADGDMPGLHAIKDLLLIQIADRRRTTDSLLEDRIDPKGLVYLLISNITFQQLCTGQHHIYRGVLSGSGQQLLSAFIMSSKRMVNHGLHDRAKHDADVASLRKELSEIG